MRNGSRISDLSDANASGLNRANRALAASAGALHAHFALVHALGNRRTGRILGDHRRGERGGLAGTLEASLTSGAPGDHAATSVSDRDLRVVERAADERDASGNRLAGTLLSSDFAFCRGSRGVRGRSDIILDFFCHFKSLP